MSLQRLHRAFTTPAFARLLNYIGVLADTVAELPPRADLLVQLTISPTTSDYAEVRNLRTAVPPDSSGCLRRLRNF